MLSSCLLFLGIGALMYQMIGAIAWFVAARGKVANITLDPGIALLGLVIFAAAATARYLGY